MTNPDPMDMLKQMQKMQASMAAAQEALEHAVWRRPPAAASSRRR